MLECTRNPLSYLDLQRMCSQKKLRVDVKLHAVLEGSVGIRWLLTGETRWNNTSTRRGRSALAVVVVSVWEQVGLVLVCFRS